MPEMVLSCGYDISSEVWFNASVGSRLSVSREKPSIERDASVGSRISVNTEIEPEVRFKHSKCINLVGLC